MKILVTGATGYIGGLLIPRLLDEGHAVRILVRDLRRLPLWTSAGIEVAVGDLSRTESLEGVFEDIDAAYYLVHSMSAGADFAERDRAAARHFATAARGVGKVIYLGGLQPPGTASAHLESRAEVGRILARELPVTEFRAGPIIGPGSASFEMLRYLTERLPVMVVPRWVDNQVQPIAIRDVLEYLVRALERPPLGVVEVGGEDRPTFREMMLGYAEVRGLRRRIIAVPVLAPSLAARWIGLVTPIPNRLAVPIVEGIVQPLVADTSKAEAEFSGIRPLGYRAALEEALTTVTEGGVRTRWSGSLEGETVVELSDREGLAREERLLPVAAPAEIVFAAVSRLGGERGWPAVGWAWRLRGAVDKLLGGPGLRRGRLDPTRLSVGEAVDFWRVEEFEPGRLLRLRAEMRLPGRAWLEWEVTPTADGSVLRQTAWFAPRGLAGALYWHVLYPFHAVIFGRLARALAREAESRKRIA
ncbi:MAG TPA: SDR family oxidoreductase [Gemmatimonadota bacterium]|nr:SDR family oxidoreductase [Gemmatimonadota bacterium]